MSVAVKISESALTASESPSRDQDKPLVSVRSLSVEFPRLSGAPTVAVRDVDLDIRPQEVVGLVGESGAGKTTLARSLLGLPPSPGHITAGRFVFDDKDIFGLSAEGIRQVRGRDISMVVSNPRDELNPLKPVGEQIATVARVHLGLSRREARQRAFDILKAVQIPDPERRMKALPHELSGGMAQRIVIAIALVCSPRFIVSDDATSGLDVTVQAQILQLLKELILKRDSSLLFITRDIGVAAHFCDRTAIMFKGEIMEIGGRDSLFLTPRHPYTIGLMSAFCHNDRLRQVWSTQNEQIEVPAGHGGCPYADRCPNASQTCLDQRPELKQVAEGHYVRCHYEVAR